MSEIENVRVTSFHIGADLNPAWSRSVGEYLTKSVLDWERLAHRARTSANLCRLQARKLQQKGAALDREAQRLEATIAEAMKVQGEFQEPGHGR